MSLKTRLKLKPSAIRVWYSNELKRLAERLIKNIVAQDQNPVKRLFTTAPIIGPNRSIETFLDYEFAPKAAVGERMNWSAAPIIKFIPSR